MSREKLTLEEAENIVDNMYQNRWKECGVEEGNTIHMGNLENLHYSELERASIRLLRAEIRLKRENKKYKEILNKIRYFLDNHDKNVGNLYYKYNNKYLLSEIKEDIRDILKEV